MPFEPGLEPSRLRGGAESPWNTNGDRSSAYSSLESTHIVPSSEPLRPGDPSKSESTSDSALLATEPASPPLSRHMTLGLGLGLAGLGVPSPAAPTREGLNGTARMLGCRDAVVLSAVTLVSGGMPGVSEEPRTHGTGLFLSGVVAEAAPAVVAGPEAALWGRWCAFVVRRLPFISREGSVSSCPTFLIRRWRQSLHSRTVIAMRSTKRPTMRPAMRPTWLIFGRLEAFEAEGEDEVE